MGIRRWGRGVRGYLVGDGSLLVDMCISLLCTVRERKQFMKMEKI